MGLLAFRKRLEPALPAQRRAVSPEAPAQEGVFALATSSGEVLNPGDAAELNGRHGFFLGAWFSPDLGRDRKGAWMCAFAAGDLKAELFLPLASAAQHLRRTAA
jgi:hypothetical protein